MFISPRSGSFLEQLRAALCWLLALAVAFVNPVPAQAQVVVSQSRDITPISNGTGFLIPAEELVITNHTDYASFFNGTPPASPTVDFSTEDVLAVTLGAQPQGSSVNISGVDVRTTGFTAGFAFVHVVSTIATSVSPVTITGGTASNTGGAFFQSGGVFVYTGGTFVFGPTAFNGSGGVWSASGATGTINGGTTTAGSQTFSNWSLSNIGGTISGAGAVSGGGGTVNWTGGTASTTSLGIQIVGGVVTVTGGTASSTAGPFTVAGGTTTLTPPVVYPYSVVKLNKGALAYSFIHETPGSTSGPVPNSFTYSIGGGSAPYTERISYLSSDFSMRVDRFLGSGLRYTRYEGTLNSGEAQTLTQAFQKVNVTTLPPTVPGGSTLTTLPWEMLSGVIGSETYSTRITQAGFYGGSSNLKSLIDAMRGPAERIVRGTQSMAHAYKGVVSFQNNVLSVGPHQIDPSDPFYPLITSDANSEVFFGGDGKSTSPSVLYVAGIVIPGTSGASLLSFPNVGADVEATLPAGTPLQVTDFTLFGNYVEAQVTSGPASGQRGFVDREVVVTGYRTK